MARSGTCHDAERTTRWVNRPAGWYNIVIDMQVAAGGPGIEGRGIQSRDIEGLTPHTLADNASGPAFAARRPVAP